MGESPARLAHARQCLICGGWFALDSRIRAANRIGPYARDICDPCLGIVGPYTVMYGNAAEGGH